MTESTPTPRTSDVSIREYPGATIAVVHNGVMHWTPMFGDGQDWQRSARVDEDGRAVLGINGMAARVGDAVVAIDPNALTADDAPSTAELELGSPFGVALEAIGAMPDEVTHVVITHGHFDHFTGLTEPRGSDQLMFPNAEHVFPAADVPTDGTSGPHIDPVRQAIGILDAAGRLRLSTGDEEVAPGVSILAAPGESAGHQVVRLTAGDEYVYYLGDLVHFPIEVEHPEWVPLRNRDVPTLIESRHRVFTDRRDRPATFVFTHAPFPGWGRIDVAGDRDYTWRFD
jgi:glyoxylase-like metal-dependent hydrolase (beta-lactamase superfamily II)